MHVVLGLKTGYLDNLNKKSDFTPGHGCQGKIWVCKILSNITSMNHYCGS